MMLLLILCYFFALYSSDEFAIPEKREPIPFSTVLSSYVDLGYQPLCRANGTLIYSKIEKTEDVVVATRNLNNGLLPLTISAKHAIAQALTDKFLQQDIALQYLSIFADLHKIHPASVAKISETIKTNYEAIEYAQTLSCSRPTSGQRRSRSKSFYQDEDPQA